MRPGPYPWATDNNFNSIGNPWHNQPTKIQPSAGKAAEGWEPQDQPPADYWNWFKHRYHVSREEIARASCVDFRAIPGSLAPFANPVRRKYVFDQANAVHLVLSTSNAGGGDQTDYSYLDGLFQASALALPGPKPANANVTGMADDLNGRIMAVLAGGAAGDDVFYLNNLAAWTNVGWVPGPPGLSWTHVDCDPSGPRWIIADDAGGGNIVAWFSVDGINYSALAGFPAAMGANQTISLKHTRHQAGALGPDDAGNLAWICFNSTNMARSADGIAWTSAAHGLNVPSLGADSNDKIAYSRTSARWVIPGGAGSLGDVFYSDDNGASWATLSGVLSPTPTSIQGIACDGYGTFIIYDSQSVMTGAPVAPFGVQMWVSVDDGLTWSYHVVVPAQYSASYARLDLRPYGLYDLGTPNTTQGFSMISHSGVTCAIERSITG